MALASVPNRLTEFCYRCMVSLSTLTYYNAWWSTLQKLPLSALWKRANFVKLYICPTKHKFNTYDEYLTRSKNCVSICSTTYKATKCYSEPKNVKGYTTFSNPSPPSMLNIGQRKYSETSQAIWKHVRA